VGGKSAELAYEALLTGNVTEAQQLAAQGMFSGVVQIDTFSNRQLNRRRGGIIGIPMIATHNWSTGRISGETQTQVYQDDTKTDVNYGIFMKEENSRFFLRHKKFIRSFYSAKAITKDAGNKVIGEEEKATFYWMHETDVSSTNRLNAAMNLFYRDLGMRSAFNVEIPNRQSLGYVKVEAKVDLPESFLKMMIETAASGRTLEIMQANAQGLMADYFANGDADNLCRDEEGANAEDLRSCFSRLSRETNGALSRMRNIINGLVSRTSDASAYTYNMAMLGRELIRNQFILKSFMKMDKSCKVNFELTVEGRRLNQMVKKVPANEDCRK
jgi:hypothetical protein